MNLYKKKKIFFSYKRLTLKLEFERPNTTVTTNTIIVVILVSRHCKIISLLHVLSLHDPSFPMNSIFTLRRPKTKSR